jgi:hypothetical protein
MTEESIIQREEIPAAVLDESRIESVVREFEAIRKFVVRALNPELRSALREASKQGRRLSDQELRELEKDYGTIPGSSRPFLKQPGAEKIAMWCGVRPTYEVKEHELGDGHLEVVSHCRLLNRDGHVVSEAICSCSTRESNFAYRWMVPPSLPSEEEQKNLRFTGQARLVPRQRGSTVEYIFQVRVPNPNVWDERNKVRQMALKRSFVRAVRTYAALSDFFAEDPSEWGYELAEQSDLAATAPLEQRTPAGQEPPKPLPTTTAETPKEQPRPASVIAYPHPSEPGKPPVLYRLGGDFYMILDELKSHGLVENSEAIGGWTTTKSLLNDIASLCAKRGITFRVLEENAETVFEPEVERSNTREVHDEIIRVTTKSADGRDLRSRSGNAYMRVETKSNGIVYCFDTKLFEPLASARGKKVKMELVEGSKGYWSVTSVEEVNS